LSSITISDYITLYPLNTKKIANLCGQSNEHIKSLENYFDVTINQRDNGFKILGTSTKTLDKVKLVLSMLYQKADKSIKPELVNAYMKNPYTPQACCVKLRKKIIESRNNVQKNYLTNVDKHDIVFAVGPAGTGKTYLAVAKAVEALEKGQVQRLIFVRPAVEAGEKLGFLPGDLVDKVLPYLRPIYDALYEFLGFHEAQKLIKNDIIEILPLAFMRGRTLNEAFIILDEAQNTTKMQMKMFLTRIGFGSKALITGDTSQTDLPNGIPSGLSHAVKLFKNKAQISVTVFSSKEVVRHPLVSKIIDTYDAEKGDK
jgi:phosphate starvation-inducible protein PhoH and related proteins